MNKRGLIMDEKTIDKNEMLRSLIRMADSFEDADRIIMEFTRWRSSEQKLAFLDGLFTYSMLSHDDADVSAEEQVHFDYVAVLNTIVKAKWR